VTRPLEDGFAPGDHGTTFGGSPPLAAAALAVLDTIAAERLVENAARSATISVRPHGAPGVRDVRGLGLLLGVELRDGDASGVAARLLSEQRVLVNAVTSTALRLCPPLCLTRGDADRAVEALAAVLGDPTPDGARWRPRVAGGRLDPPFKGSAVRCR
jgi:acetylornithine aminotransferase